jgi:CRP-like cAMP-binding protein
VLARSYSAGQIVFQQGDPSDVLVIVVTGRIVISSLSPEGAQVMLNIIGPAEVAGEIALLDGGPRSADATAVRDTRALLLGHRDFLALLESEPSATRSLLLLLCARIRQTTSFVEDAVLQTLPARLLHRVQTLASSYGHAEVGRLGLRIEHGLSQQDLGDSIGASRVSVSNQLNAWRSQALLDFGRGFVVVHDMARLEAAVSRAASDRGGPSSSDSHQV